jgi:pilus assembly protein CpaC
MAMKLARFHAQQLMAGRLSGAFMKFAGLGLAACAPTARPVVLAALAALALSAPFHALDAAEMEATPAMISGTDANMRFVALGIGKSVVVNLPQDAKDVLVANTTIANAVVRSARRAYLIGLAQGQTNVFFFDAEGRQIAGFDIAVTRDLNGVRAALKQMLPQSDVRIEGVNDGVMLTGSVANPGESQQAFDLAMQLVGGGGKVVNGLTIRGRDQVMLRVTVAEVQRDLLKQLGINLNGTFNYGNAVVDFNTVNAFSVSGTAPDTFITSQAAPSKFAIPGLGRVGATIRAMEQAGVVRTLAEPNLTAISGENANFLAGGEFPVLAGRSCDATGLCTQTVTYKKFGIGLNFTPVVLSEGRISLKVATEVSELSSEGALVITGQDGFTLPSVKVRRAETTVEIPSGGSLAMAGMIAEQTKQAINGLPGLMQLPVLGTLFKSRDYINRQSELMVLVTPYVVRAVARKELSRPDDGFVDASDPATVLLSKFNRIYGVSGKAEPPRAYHGNYGFILD